MATAGSSEDGRVTADPEDRRRIGDAVEQRRVGWIEPRDRRDPVHRPAARSASARRQRLAPMAASARPQACPTSCEERIRDPAGAMLLEDGGDPGARGRENGGGDGDLKVIGPSAARHGHGRPAGAAAQLGRPDPSVRL